MSDDLIRRSDAVGACAYETIECYEARKAIRELPSADRPQEWIPCSERTPEKEGDYIVTLHHKWSDKEYKTVEVEEFRNGGFDENLYVKVVAWMPKPKPWEGAVNDSDNI